MGEIDVKKKSDKTAHCRPDGACRLGEHCAAAADPASTRDYYPVPREAVVRPLGIIAHGVCDPGGAQECAGQPDNPADVLLPGGYPLDVPGLGIPVGGVGAGSFMVNQSGTFGP